MPTVAELMTRDPATIGPHASVQRAAQLMADLRVEVLPVRAGTELLGIVTDGDIVMRAIAAGLDPASTPVALVMSDHVRCCSPQQTLGEVLRRMQSARIRQLPVVDDDFRLVGIVSLGHLAAARSEGDASQPGAGASTGAGALRKTERSRAARPSTNGAAADPPPRSSASGGTW